MKFAEAIKWKFSGPRSPTVFFLFSILLGLLVIISGCSNDLDLRMLTTSVSYDLNIQTNETLSNVTFYIPLPVKDGKPVVGERVLQESDFVDDSFQVIFDKNLRMENNYIETSLVQEEGQWFVKLSATKISPEQEKSFQYEIKIDNSTRVSSPNRFLNTILPIGNESTFLPKFQFVVPPVTITPANVLFHQSYNELTIPHYTTIFASYTANPSAKVEITSVLKHRNEWKEQYDAWVGNSCSEYVTWEHVGEAHGWYQARDVLYAGRGVYPNLSSPEWQKVIEKTQ